MAAVSMHGSENAFGGMNSGMNRRLSPAFRTLASPLRQRHFDLEKLRELARSDEFSDSESDGVSDNEEEDEDDVADTMFVPYRRPSPKRKTRRRQGQQQSQGRRVEIVDKSPTFESVAEGRTELGGESWFVQDREQ
ncbi:hypothetical protein AM588_10006742 [Phytophthora nicotianae]|uniref:Uncharacterized protein n=1 Tax=Phytophthora nicotianae TaxID=4792 RepID=A0A0W8DAC3_PHYNI|nr:hypothetical protein AM588_10006742 [Phytophthora nicotianae]